MGVSIAAAGVLCSILVGITPFIHAQELEPRSYSASPLGTNFFAAGISSSSGDVLLDPSVPITDVHADIYAASAGYGRTFGFAGCQGLLTVAVPYAVAHVEGNVNEATQRVRRSGFADFRFRASLNVLGSRALPPAEFAKAARKTILGVSLTVQTPNGQYDPSKLVNLGNYRWAFKPEIGVSVPVGRWWLEAAGGAWFFTANESYYPGTSIKRQDPLTSLQVHASYTFTTKAWIALDATWYGGGEVTIGDGPPSSRFSNSRGGMTFSQPVAAHQSLKLAASRGASARTGSNFTSYAIGWQIVWFDKPRSSR